MARALAAAALAIAVLSLGGGSAAARPAAGCHAAVVRLGDAPGAIDFNLRCRPCAGTGVVRFGLGLSPLRQRGQVRIRAFRRHPRVREGAVLRHGRCSLTRDC